MMILIKNAVFLNPLKKNMNLINRRKLKMLYIMLIDSLLIRFILTIDKMSKITKIKQLKIKIASIQFQIN